MALITTKLESSTLPDYPVGPTEVFDKNNPISPINLVAESTQREFEFAHKRRPDLFLMDEKELYKQLRSESKTPTPTDNRIRMKFWLEYDRAVSLGSKISMTNIATGVCSLGFLKENYLSKAEKVAWMLTIPASYQVIAEEALIFGLEQLREILSMDHIQSKVDPKSGKIVEMLDHKLLDMKAKIVMMLDMRVKGGVTQRIEQKNLNMHLDATPRDINQMMEANSMEALKKKLDHLEAMERRLINGGVVPPTVEDIVLEGSQIEHKKG